MNIWKLGSKDTPATPSSVSKLKCLIADLESNSVENFIWDDNTPLEMMVVKNNVTNDNRIGFVPPSKKDA